MDKDITEKPNRTCPTGNANLKLQVLFDELQTTLKSCIESAQDPTFKIVSSEVLRLKSYLNERVDSVCISLQDEIPLQFQSTFDLPVKKSFIGKGGQQQIKSISQQPTVSQEEAVRRTERYKESRASEQKKALWKSEQEKRMEIERREEIDFDEDSDVEWEDNLESIEPISSTGTLLQKQNFKKQNESNGLDQFSGKEGLPSANIEKLFQQQSQMYNEQSKSLLKKFHGLTVAQMEFIRNYFDKNYQRASRNKMTIVKNISEILNTSVHSVYSYLTFLSKENQERYMQGIKQIIIEKGLEQKQLQQEQYNPEMAASEFETFLNSNIKEGMELNNYFDQVIDRPSKPQVIGVEKPKQAVQAVTVAASATPATPTSHVGRVVEPVIQIQAQQLKGKSNNSDDLNSISSKIDSLRLENDIELCNCDDLFGDQEILTIINRYAKPVKQKERKLNKKSIQGSHLQKKSKKNRQIDSSEDDGISDEEEDDQLDFGTDDDNEEDE